MKRDVAFQAVTERREIPQGWLLQHIWIEGKGMAGAGYLQQGAMLEHPKKNPFFRC